LEEQNSKHMYSAYTLTVKVHHFTITCLPNVVILPFNAGILSTTLMQSIRREHRIWFTKRKVLKPVLVSHML